MRLGFLFFLMLWGGIPLHAADKLSQSLQKKLISISQKARHSEQERAKIEADLVTLNQRSQETQKQLQERREQFYRILQATQKLSRHGLDAIVRSLRSSDQMIHTAILLRSLTNVLKQNNHALNREFETLSLLKQRIDLKRDVLKDTKERFDQQTKKIEKLISQRRALLKKEMARRKKIEARNKALAKKAHNVTELIATIDGDKKSTAIKVPGLDRGPLDTKGHYEFLPVQGQVISPYGTVHPTNTEGVGTVFATRPGARVLSPVEGQIVFSGPFRLYQQIIIIKHHKSYYTLLVGIDRVDVDVGQVVAPGEPLGLMSFDDSHPHLYMELRRNDTPINPKAWLSYI